MHQFAFHAHEECEGWQRVLAWGRLLGIIETVVSDFHDMAFAKHVLPDATHNSLG